MVATTIAVTISTTFAVLPPILLGATSPLVGHDLRFDHSQLGITVAVFFFASAVASPVGGLLVRRVGVAVATSVSSLLSLSSFISIAAATAWPLLTMSLALGGLANGLAQATANEALAFGIPRTHQGLATGIKQASIPFAALLAGLAIPTFAVSFGWRRTFLMASLLPLSVNLPSFLRPLSSPRASYTSPEVSGRSRKRVPLLVIAFACGTAATSCVAVFLIESAVAEGISIRLAGILFAVNSALSIASRVTYGWIADRHEIPHFIFIAILLLVGSLGTLAMSLGGSHFLFWTGSVLAFVGGWSWNGLFVLTLVRSVPTTPAVATGTILAGGFVGSAVGPLSFGLVAENASIHAAWLLVAAIAAISAALMMAWAHSSSPQRDEAVLLPSERPPASETSP